VRPRKWNAPGRGDGARAGRLGTAASNPDRRPRCALAQAAPAALVEALGAAQRDLQTAIVEALARGATCELRARILDAEAALGAARHLLNATLGGRASC
jgi:hypothetical protein